MDDICCEHPVIIYNKAAIDLIEEFGYFFCNGRILYPRHGQKLPPCKLVGNINDYYVYTITGKRIPCYMRVPCGKCVLCSDTKRRFLALRFEAETAHFDKHKPLFVTYTYKPKCRPKGKDNIDKKDIREDENFQFSDNCCVGVCKRDVQNMFRKLRNYLYDDGLPTDFRYFVSGEYGTRQDKNHYPHYHVIYWNLPDKSYFDLYTLTGKEHDKGFPLTDWQWLKLLETRYLCPAWSDDGRLVPKAIKERYKSLHGVTRSYYSKGKVDVEVCGESKKKRRQNKLDSGSSSGAARYSAKYIGKDYNPRNYINKPFTCSSNRTGGIGMHWIRERVDESRKFWKENKVSITNPWTLQVYETSYPPQYRQYLFPTVSRFVPSRVMKAFKEFVFCFDAIKSMTEEQDLFRSSDCITQEVFDILEAFRYVHINRYAFVKIRKEFEHIQLLHEFEDRLKDTLPTLLKFARKHPPEEIEELLQLHETRADWIETLPRKQYDIEGLVYQKSKVFRELLREDYF